MPTLGAILRFLMLAACLVPFTSAQQALGALAPVLPATPAPAPDAPAHEEEDEREEPDGTERNTAPSRFRAHAREHVGTLPAIRHTPRTHLTAPRPAPVAADPFRNGLGAPYRC